MFLHGFEVACFRLLRAEVAAYCESARTFGSFMNWKIKHVGLGSLVIFTMLKGMYLLDEFGS